MPSAITDPRDHENEVLLGRGSPALMSPKEPAIKLLTERYSESFALTFGSERRVHLFLVKIGLWSLVYTFVFKEAARSEKSGTMLKALFAIKRALSGEDQNLANKLDKSVEAARVRIKEKVAKFESPA
ncbi:MAG: hypothetical protein ACYC7D_12030 [Nitrososphaerales archaeon]